MNGDRALRLKIREGHTVFQRRQGGAYTYIEIYWRGIIGDGWAKYNPNDMKNGLPYSSEMGILKATNKAIEDVVRQIHLQRSAYCYSLTLPQNALPAVAP